MSEQLTPLVPLFFFLDESVVDQTLQSLQDAGNLPSRAYVFGGHAHRLRALDLQWSRSMELTIVLVPGDHSEIQDAVISILENELQRVDRVIWIQGPATEMRVPCGVHAVVQADCGCTPGLSNEVGKLLSSA